MEWKDYRELGNDGQLTDEEKNEVDRETHWLINCNCSGKQKHIEKYINTVSPVFVEYEIEIKVREVMITKLKENIKRMESSKVNVEELQRQIENLEENRIQCLDLLKDKQNLMQENEVLKCEKEELLLENESLKQQLQIANESFKKLVWEDEELAEAITKEILEENNRIIESNKSNLEKNELKEIPLDEPIDEHISNAELNGQIGSKTVINYIDNLYVKAEKLSEKFQITDRIEMHNFVENKVKNWINLYREDRQLDRDHELVIKEKDLSMKEKEITIIDKQLVLVEKQIELEQLKENNKHKSEEKRKVDNINIVEEQFSRDHKDKKIKSKHSNKKTKSEQKDKKTKSEYIDKKTKSEQIDEKTNSKHKQEIKQDHKDKIKTYCKTFENFKPTVQDCKSNEAKFYYDREKNIIHRINIDNKHNRTNESNRRQPQFKQKLYTAKDDCKDTHRELELKTKLKVHRNLIYIA